MNFEMDLIIAEERRKDLVRMVEHERFIRAVMPEYPRLKQPGIIPQFMFWLHNLRIHWNRQPGVS